MYREMEMVKKKLTNKNSGTRDEILKFYHRRSKVDQRLYLKRASGLRYWSVEIT